MPHCSLRLRQALTAPEAVWAATHMAWRNERSDTDWSTSGRPRRKCDVFIPESEKVAYVVTTLLRSNHLFLDHLSPDQELILIRMYVIRQVGEPCAV